MDNIALAYELASRLWSEGRSGPDGLVVLAMALGIYMEAQEGIDREIQPAVKMLCKEGMATFDQFRVARAAKGGNA